MMIVLIEMVMIMNDFYNNDVNDDDGFRLL